MTILLYKDGKLIVDADQPLEGVSLDNLAAILSGASDGDVIQYDATNGMWVNKTAPSSLPEVTASDKGKYLKANESTGDPEWAPGGSDLPTDPAQDGTYNLQNTVSSGTSTLSWASGGSSGGVLVVNVTYDEETLTYTADKTAGEIINAMPLVYVIQQWTGDHDETMSNYAPLSLNGNAQAAYGYKEGTGYYFYYSDPDYNEYTLVAATLNDYPTYTNK